jgi:hypothetical protein
MTGHWFKMLPPGLKTPQTCLETPEMVRKGMKRPDTARNIKKRPKTVQHGPTKVSLASPLIQGEFSAPIGFCLRPPKLVLLEKTQNIPIFGFHLFIKSSLKLVSDSGVSYQH